MNYLWNVKKSKPLKTCCICNGFKTGECITIDDEKYHIGCIVELVNKPISYDRLLEIARKMHLWIFLHTSNEFEVYDELGLTDKENSLLGSSKGQFTIDDPEVVNHIKDVIEEIEGGKK